MGNKSQPSITKDNEEDLVFHHPRFLSSSYKMLPKDEQRISVMYKVQSEKEYAKWEKKLKRNPGSKQCNVLNPIEHKYVKNGICGSSGFIEIEYENYPLTLKDEIENRKKEKQFAENQLWYLLLVLARVAALYHYSGVKVGDIRPLNVLLDLSGQIRIGTIYSWPNEDDSYIKTLKYGQKTYLPPESIEDLKIGRSIPHTDYVQAESFSIGLTMLSACLLQDCEKLYRKQNEFKFQQLEGLKNELKNCQQYSPKLKNIIFELTEIEPSRRLKAFALEQMLLPYQRKILQLQTFSFDDSFSDEKKKSNILIQENSTVEDHEDRQPVNSKRDYSFGSHHFKKGLPKTGETTSLIRSQNSNIYKSQSPIMQISNEKLFANPHHHHYQTSMGLPPRDRSISKKVQAGRQIKPEENHPYFTNIPVNAPVTPTVAPAGKKTIVLKDNKKENSLVINFTYNNQNKKVKNIPFQNSRPSSASMMRKVQSTRSLHVESKERSRVQTKWEDNNQPATSQYYVTNSVMSRADERIPRQEREEGRSRASSLQLIDEKIAFSRRMFPY